MPILTYVHGNTLIHKLNPITKMMIVLLIWILSLISFDIITFLIILMILTILWIVGRIPLGEMVVFIKMLSIIFFIFTLINGFMYYRGRTPLFYVFGYSFTIEGLMFGITLSLKVLCIVSSIPIITKTTTISDFIMALNKLRIPYVITFALTTAINFIDTINEIYQNIKESQYIRGYSIDEMNFLKRITKGYAPLFIPLILITLRKASLIDLAIESRAYGATKRRTYISELKLTKYDILFLTFILSIVVIMIIYNIVYGKIILWLPV